MCNLTHIERPLWRFSARRTVVKKVISAGDLTGREQLTVKVDYDQN